MRRFSWPRARALAFGLVGVGCLTGWAAWALVTARPVEDAGWFTATAMVPGLAVSVLLLARLPGAAVTRLVVIMTGAHLVGLGLQAAAIAVPSHSQPGSGWWVGLLWLGTLPLLPLLLVVFPDGVPRRGPWRLVFAGQLAALVVLAAQVLYSTLAGERRPMALSVVVGVALAGSGVARALSLVALWWRSGGLRRRQLGAFVVVAAVIAGAYLLAAVWFVLTGTSPGGGAVVQNLVFTLVVGGLPVALALAVLQHRLFGIEVVVNRVAVAAFASLLLLAVYSTSAALAAEAFGVGQGFHFESVLPAAFTVLVLAPAYRLARGVVDRAMFGDRDRPDRAVRTLARRLGETLDPEHIPQAVVELSAEALRLPFVALEQCTPSGSVRVATSGSAPASNPVVTLPVQYQGDRLADLLVAPRHGEPRLDERDKMLLSELVAQAGPALYAAKLVRDLADSRERLRQGRLEERAHLRRALHDGLSPTLSGIALAAAAARARDPGNPDVVRLLARIEDEAGSGARTLRALLAGLRPPGLSELGLAQAVEQRTRQLAESAGLPIDVTVEDPLPPVDPRVEQTAYLVVVELLTNAVRHAEASQLSLSLCSQDGDLVADVRDNGRGLGCDFQPGEGLRSAQERLLAEGGELSISRVPAGGTLARLRLPGWRT